MVLASASLAFILLKLAPGDQFTAFASSPGVSPELLAFWRNLDGNTLPLPSQYLLWLGALLRGDFGYSTANQLPVTQVLLNTLPNTLLLMGLALVASVLFGIVIGAWQGAHSGSRRDRVMSTAMLVIYSFPEFWLALALMLVFSGLLGILPSAGMTSETYSYLSWSGRVLDRMTHLILPWLTLTLVGTAIFSRYQRAAMRSVLREPFVQTARAKGLDERQVLRRHALRTALLPVITIGGLMFPAIVSGAVFVESIFAWPGMGNALITGVNERDYPIVSGTVIVIAAMTTLGSLLADLVREVVDPRLRT